MPAVDRFRYLGCLFLCSLFLLTSEGNAAEKEKLAVKGEKLYTQFSFFYEGDHHITTNYRKGVLVPINTEVEFVKASRKRITIKIPTYDATVNIENEEDYSGEKIGGIFARMFAREKVDVSKFSKDEQSQIKNGTVSTGMTKDAVVRALGFPPKHKTPSLNLDQWRYWKNRFDTMLVVFEDGKVARVQD